MRSLAVIMMLLLLTRAEVLCFENEKSDLSGTWLLDIQKSDFDGEEKPVSGVLVIHYRSSHVRLSQSVRYRHNRMDNFKCDLLIDDKRRLIDKGTQYNEESQIFFNGPSLVVDRHFTTPDNSAKGIDITTYTLKDQGETLMAQEKSQALSGRVSDRVWVFRKKRP